MAVLTVTKPSRLVPIVAELDTFGTPWVVPNYAGNDTFVNKKNRYMLVVANMHATNTFTVIVSATKAYAGIDLPDESVTIAANSVAFIGPFDENFEVAVTKVVTLTYTGTSPDAGIAVMEIIANDE